MSGLLLQVPWQPVSESNQPMVVPQLLMTVVIPCLRGADMSAKYPEAQELSAIVIEKDLEPWVK